MLPVEEVTAMCPLISMATAPTVSCPSRLVSLFFWVTGVAVLSWFTCLLWFSCLNFSFMYIWYERSLINTFGSPRMGKSMFLANLRAPSPASIQCDVSVITLRAKDTGFEILWTQTTAPTDNNRENDLLCRIKYQHLLSPSGNSHLPSFLLEESGMYQNICYHPVTGLFWR